MLEGKFASASFTTGSSTKTSEGGGESNRPAVIIGGYDADQAAEDTLRLQTLTELKIDLDLAPMFVPGLRRWFAILPLRHERGKTSSNSGEEFEHCEPYVLPRSSREHGHKAVTATSLPL